MAHELHTQIRIQATPETVWSIFSDFKNYSRWNPFIRAVEGSYTPGAKLRVLLQQPGSKGMTMTPTLLAVVPNREFRWIGRLLMPGLFDGEHRFELHDNGDGSTTFIQAERFKGILVPFLKKMLDTKTRAGFEQMNQALKTCAESGKS
jgi:hypothetical protein